MTAKETRYVRKLDIHTKIYCCNGHEKTSETTGKKGQCKICNSERGKLWRAKNRERFRASIDEWEKNNPEKVKAARRKWRANNPEKVRMQSAKDYAKTPAEIRNARGKKYYWQHHSEIRKRDTKRTAELGDGYIASKLGTSLKNLTPELIEFKRLHLALKRGLRNATSNSK